MTLNPGVTVRVRDDWPEARGRAHIRTPHYLRGREGRIVRHLGSFPNPEDLAFARPAERRDLYHVAFGQDAVWSDSRRTEELPGGAALQGSDELLVELYEHWLEPA